MAAKRIRKREERGGKNQEEPERVNIAHEIFCIFTVGDSVETQVREENRKRKLIIFFKPAPFVHFNGQLYRNPPHELEHPRFNRVGGREKSRKKERRDPRVRRRKEGKVK